jgi:hypothetical protein
VGKQLVKVILVLLILVIGVFYLNEKKAREENLELIKERNETIAASLSKDPERAFIVVLGDSEKIKEQLDALLGHYINIVKGYSENPEPSKRELRDYEVKTLPVFIVFDTKKEIFRTNEIAKLRTFLAKLENKK